MAEDPHSPGKLKWTGLLVSIQPRIRLLRMFDRKSHAYPGYVLGVQGVIGKSPESTFLVAIGQGAQKKYQFRVGDKVSGISVPVANPEIETAGYYKTSGIRIDCRAETRFESTENPPFHLPVPPLAEYRAHGHRRLDAGTYEKSCTTCAWGCRMPTQIIRDHWNHSRDSDNVTWRMETFCYGPKGCSLYKAGSKRRVPGRQGMVYQDDGESHP